MIDVDATRDHCQVADKRTRCLFCFASSEALPKLTREHLVSRPVAGAYGIDREGDFARTDARGSSVRWGVVGGQSRKVVCASCNNGWMNDLERKMATAQSWLGSWNEPLGAQRDLILRSWALKTHLLLCFVEGRAHRLGEEGVDDAVIAPFTSARQLYEQDRTALSGLHVGLARTDGADGRFHYAFGTPTLARKGPRYLGGLTAPASIITVGALQLWIATPLWDAEVRLPRGVPNSGPTLKLRELRIKPQLGDLDQIVVDYGEHDADEIGQAMIASAKALDTASASRSDTAS